MRSAAIACASVLAVACVSSEEATTTTQESPPQDGPYQGDGTAAIETKEEAVQVALWFFRGRGILAEDRQVVTTVFEQGNSWFVGVQEPGEVHPVGSGLLLEIDRSGFFMRVVPSM